MLSLLNHTYPSIKYVFFILFDFFFVVLEMELSPLENVLKRKRDTMPSSSSSDTCKKRTIEPSEKNNSSIIKKPGYINRKISC